MDPYQTSIYTAVLIAAVVIGVIIVYFILSVLRQQKLNQKLNKEKVQAEITTLENERSRMATDLHDELGPLLSSIKLKMNCLDITGEEDKRQLDKMNFQLDGLITRIREISNDLMPSALLRKGLVAAIEESLNHFRNDGLEINFTYSSIPQLNNTVSVHIYRIVQEIIHNTIKHAKATQLDLRMNTRNDKLVLETKDNGIGFNYTSTLNNSGGFGLRSLLSRVEILNGDMYIDSRKNKGTAYTFELPLEKLQYA